MSGRAMCRNSAQRGSIGHDTDNLERSVLRYRRVQRRGWTGRSQPISALYGSYWDLGSLSAMPTSWVPGPRASPSQHWNKMARSVREKWTGYKHYPSDNCRLWISFSLDPGCQLDPSMSRPDRSTQSQGNVHTHCPTYHKAPNHWATWCQPGEGDYSN